MLARANLHVRLLLLSVVIGLASHLLYSFLVKLIDDAHFSREQLEVANKLGGIRLHLEQQLNSTFYVSRGLEMLIAGLTADGSRLDDHWQDINMWAREASADIPYLVNIGLSEGYVIKFSYPKASNSKVLGVDYRDLESQWPAVERAVTSGLPVVAGPLQLVQGGIGILCRIPLYSDRYQAGKGRFIGIVSMVIDYPKLLQAAGINQAASELNLAIRGKDGLGMGGDLFLGSESAFADDGVVQTIEFLGGQWVIAAKPLNGWSHESPYSRQLTLLGYALCTGGAMLVYLALLGLTQRREAVAQFTRQLEARVEERTQQLSAAKEEAERANRAKSEFLTVVTHELRTPLNSIIGLTDLIIGMDLGRQQRELLGKVSISAALLLELINNILSYAKMESGKEQLNSSAFSLPDILNKVANLFEVAAANKSLDFSTRIAPGVPELYMGDAAKISQVLINLCGNAMKFTRHGSVTIEVTAEQSANLSVGDVVVLRFAVIDTGIGISEENQRKLFVPFSQVDSSLTRKYQGSGLGLSICRNFIGLMNGEIGVDSQLEKGSCFWFSVPLQSVQALPQGENKSSEFSASELLEQSRNRLAGSKMILAEDNEFNQLLAISLLEKIGVVVEVASNGREVLELLKQGPVNGVLMDIQMPEMDGVTATRAIRDQAAYAGLPVIALTANAMEEDRQQILMAGMNGFIAKPIKAPEFYRALLSWVDPDQSFGPK